MIRGGNQVVVFGASGDLAKRKIYPALHSLYTKKVIPDNIDIVGYGRSEFDRGAFIQQVTQFIPHPVDHGFIDRCRHIQGTYDDLKPLQTRLHEDGNRIFYMSLPPSLYEGIARSLPDLFSTSGWNRVVMEKPFGKDSQSFQLLREAIEQYIPDPSLYLMDHYLAKSAVDYMRSTPGMMEPMPKSIEVVFSESIGLEGRRYFDEYGIVRDVVQNHILQLVAVLLADNERATKLSVLRELTRMKADDTRLGQYKGYPFLPSTTPTYVETRVSWRGIPIVIKAGKAMADRLVEIRLCYVDKTLDKRINVQPFGAVMDADKSLLLDFNRPEDAYEVAIGDVFKGDHTRFVSMAEIEESWNIVDDVLKMDVFPFGYEPGMSV